MLRIRFKTILFVFTIVLFLALTLGVALNSWASWSFDEVMTEKLEAKKILQPVEVYSAPIALKPLQRFSPELQNKYFPKDIWRERGTEDVLRPGDFFKGNQNTCQDKWKLQNLRATDSCFAWQDNESTVPKVIVIDENFLILKTFLGSENTEELLLTPKIYAQFAGNDPMLQKHFTLSEISPLCPQAIMAIEDNNFFEHDGYNIKSIGRAVIKNLAAGKSAQGGSTITQQLVKNYFLSSEKTFQRKAKEMAMAIWLESKFSKDEIIETYMNIIYMGQSGAFQVRGYGSAADYYFGKKTEQLNLSECALLAAIINSPGLYNPFKNPDKARQRRNLVLKKMSELNFITKTEKAAAEESPLPQKSKVLASETAPYFLDAVRKQIQTLGLNWAGLKIYTGMSLESQQKGQVAIESHLSKFEKQEYFKKQKANGHNLEAILISANNKTGVIHTAIGGRNFRKTQFNRLTESHRQAGSVIKPFVYLTAFMRGRTASDTVLDEKKVYQYDRTKWTPENYDKKFHGEVSLQEALKNSYNASAVALSQELGLDAVIETLRASGFSSKIPNVPSIVLGSFEVYPKELLNAYLILANKGIRRNSSYIQKVENLDGQLLYINPTDDTEVFPKESVEELASILNESTVSGTAAFINKSGYLKPVAGKTGTTSDYKDAWFVGFDQENTTLVWIGFDRNLKTNLTGATGALPIWLDFVKSLDP